MSKRILLFAPAAFNLAETSRMVEIAKAVERHPEAAKIFEVHFISDGGDFERLIEKHGFALTRMEPRLTKEKIEHIARVDRGEKFAPAFTDSEMIERVDHELACLRAASPGGGRNWVVPHDPDHVPSAAHASRLGDSIHLAPGLLSPRRWHDR